MRYAGFKKLDADLNHRANLIRAHGGPIVNDEMLELTVYFLQVLGDVAWQGYLIESAEEEQC